jgi:diguanylate cyclase (GGDEF)-like protein
MAGRSVRIATHRAGRWVGASLALTLIVLTAAAVLGSWRQASLVRHTADLAARIDAYQNAQYLATAELAALQATANEPHGEEREQIVNVSAELATILRSLQPLDPSAAPVLAALHAEQLKVQRFLRRYLALLDADRTDAALAVLENDLEPVAGNIRTTLLRYEGEYFTRYEAQLGAANRESGRLLLGTVLLFVAGLAALAVISVSRRAHRRAMETMAIQDPLTGLPNRTAFQARAELALRSAGPDDPQPTVLMVDLDGFKDVNDTLGHHMGDLLLVEVGRRLRASVRPEDTVARLGGDEFALVLTGAAAAAGEEAAARIGELLSRPFLIESVSLDLEASIGIATVEAGQDVTTVVRHADLAMYVAKEQRIGHARFEAKHKHDTAARLNLLGSMRRALERDELVLHYQPKLSVDTGELIGVEALARWQHPTRGLLPPAEFIPVVENTSLVHRFTGQVLGMALAQAREWLDQGHRIPVAVNVSTRCLLDLQFPGTVADSLRATGVPGELLCIEITENTVMAHPDRAIDVLGQIRALGVRTAIDDFGTGYSSMAYLRILPIDEIKVDRSFVQHMATETGDQVLVESAVELGHNLGLRVVAEGVEDVPTLSVLRRLGCDYAQGYHFAKPLPPTEFAEWLRTSTDTSATGQDTASHSHSASVSG